VSADNDSLEARRGELQVRLDALKSQRERNELGQFATPPFLARQIAEYVCELWRGRSDRIRFLDPALGTGSFYSALRATIPQDLIESALGIEIDEAFAQAASELWAGAGLRVLTGDFTRLTPPTERERCNLVLTNPPYVRHHHLNRSEKLRLKRLSFGTLGRGINGLAGLYCYFMLLSHDWLNENGIGVWLVPSEFMTVNYGQALRHYLAAKVTLLRIHRFDPEDLQFNDALVSSAIVVFRKAAPGPRHKPVLSYGGSLVQPRQEESVPLHVLAHSHKWTALEEQDLFAAAPHRVALGSLFTIKRGIATGANDFFVLPREDATRRGFAGRFLRPVLPSPRYLQQAVIESDDQGYPVIERQLALIDTDLSEEELRHACRPLWEYLCEGRRAGLTEKYLLAKRTPWYKQEQRPPAPYLCTYMGRAGKGGQPFRFVWNKSQAVAPNVYLLLYPIGPLRDLLTRRPEQGKTVFELLQRIDGGDLIKEGRVYGGGLYKMEPKELGRISAEAFVEALGLTVQQPVIQESLALP